LLPTCCLPLPVTTPRPAPPRTAHSQLSQYLSFLTAAAILGLATELLALTLLFQHPKSISQAAQHKLAKKMQGQEERRETSYGMILSFFLVGGKISWLIQTVMRKIGDVYRLMQIPVHETFIITSVSPSERTVHGHSVLCRFVLYSGSQMATVCCVVSCCIAVVRWPQCAVSCHVV